MLLRKLDDSVKSVPDRDRDYSPYGQVGLRQLALDNSPSTTHPCDNSPRDPLLKYIETTWIGKSSGRKKKLPLFEHCLWNCYEVVKDYNNRPNNAVQAWHRGFSVKIQKSHETLWKFLYCIQVEQGVQENRISDLSGGKNDVKRKRQCVEMDERLSSVVANYDKKEILQYLQNIGLNVFATLRLTSTKMCC